MSRENGAWPVRLWTLHTASPMAALLSLVSVAVLIQSALAAHANLVSPAWHDLWDWVPEYQRWLDGKYGVRDVLAPYYEHRIVLTKVLLLIDSALDGMNGRLIQCIALLLLAALGWIVWHITRLDAPESAPASVPPLFWVALLSSLAQYENINLPFQVQFPIACVASALACLLLAKATIAAGSRAASLAAAAGIAGIVAAFSMGSGILLAPSLFVLLVLRRARPVVWSVFAPLSVLGVLLFFHGHAAISQPGVALLDRHLTAMRVIYSLNFLAAGLGAYPAIATWAGAAGLAAFAAACLALAGPFLLRHRAVPAPDAALVALGLLVVLCAPAGTLTNRLLLGTDAALASRYATMSLVFAAALLGLTLRWAARAAPLWVSRVAVPALALAGLCLANAPIYLGHAAGLHRVVLADTQLLVNNVGAEGRTPTIFLGTVDTVRADITILHARKLNMFSGSYGPPADLIAGLARANPAALPACRGYIDHTYAIDASAVMIAGWIIAPTGQASASWVAVLDQANHVLGTAPSLDDRPDVRAALAMTQDARGFAGGVRLVNPGASGETRTLHLLGLFPGATPAVCALLMPASIGPIPIEPAARLSRLAPAPASAAPDVRGAAPLAGVLLAASGPVPGQGAAWGFLALGRPAAAAEMIFPLTPGLGAGRALAVPFFTTGQEPAQRIAITLADGTQLETELPYVWSQAGWRAAIVPAELLALHGGATVVKVHAGGQAWLAVGTPLAVTLAPEWSRLF